MFKRALVILIAVIIILIITLSVLASVVLYNLYSEDEHHLLHSLNKLKQIIALGKTDELTLTIYYSTPLDDREPMSVDGLKEYVDLYGSEPDDGIYMIIVDGEKLKGQEDILTQLCDYYPLMYSFSEAVDTRIYYELKCNDEVIIDVVLWSRDIKYPFYNMSLGLFINNVEFDVRCRTAYIEFILPYLREEDAQELRYFLREIQD